MELIFLRRLWPWLWHCVVCREHDVLEEHFFFHFRVKSKWSRKPALILLASCLAYSSTVMTEAVCSPQKCFALYDYTVLNPEGCTFMVTAMRIVNPTLYCLIFLLSSQVFSFLLNIPYDILNCLFVSAPFSELCLACGFPSENYRFSLQKLTSEFWYIYPSCLLCEKIHLQLGYFHTVVMFHFAIAYYPVLGGCCIMTWHTEHACQWFPQLRLPYQIYNIEAQ